MTLAGIPVEDRVVVKLARRLRDAGLDDTAESLEEAYYAERQVAALTIPEREAILRVLEDCPDGSPSSAAFYFVSMSGGCERGWCRSRRLGAQFPPGARRAGN
jgi:hypothetical protein